MHVIPILLGGPAHGVPCGDQPLRNSVAFAPEFAAGSVPEQARHATYEVGVLQALGEPDVRVRYLAWRDLSMVARTRLAWEWLVENAFAAPTCTFPDGFGQVRDANCPRHNPRPPHTISGA